MKIVYKIILINLVFISFIYSQDNAFREKFIDAEYFFLYENYAKAVSIYLDIYNQEPANANINYKIGLCYLNLPLEKEKAIYFLENAVQDITSKYKGSSYKEIQAPKDAVGYLGDAYRINNMPDEAIVVYENYKNSLKVKQIYEIDLINRKIETCDNAKYLLSLPVGIIETNLGEKINSSFPEYNAVVSADESTLIFTSKREPAFEYEEEEPVEYVEEIFFSKKVDGNWTTPKIITQQIESEGYCSSVSLSHDGMQLFLYCEDFGVGDIYESKYINDKWTPIQKLNKNINSKYWESHACLSPDGTTLYFASGRKHGFGGYDIYKSEFDVIEQEWGPAVNLGPTINTPYNEVAPFILEDEKTLFFSSEGHYNMGGFDIFSSKMLDTAWSVPHNMGYPVNTPGNDLFFMPVKDGMVAYYADMKKDGYGDNDIYRLKIFPRIPTKIVIKGIFSLQDRGIHLDESVKISIVDSIKDTIAIFKPNLENGKYSYETVPGEYQIIFQGDGYKQKIEHISLPETFSQSELIVDAELVPEQVGELVSFVADTASVTDTGEVSYIIDTELVPEEVIKGEYIVIKSIFFEYGSSSLNRDAQIEIERLYMLMDENPSLYLEVIGHTDAKSSASFNQKLSEKRSRSVINYLIGKGIDQERFVAKGIGEAEHIAINTNLNGTDNPEGRKLNRRIDVKILKTNNEMIITKPVLVPDHLRFEKYVRYSVLLLKRKKKLSDDYFDKYQENNITNVMTYPTDDGYIYTVGDFTHKAEAVALLNNSIDLGFSDARIIDNFELMELTSEIVVTHKAPEEIGIKGTTIYTVQIMALKKPVKSSYFTQLDGVIEYIGTDGYHRYIYGEFAGIPAANKELRKILKMGYLDAFIMNINRYKHKMKIKRYESE